MKTKIYKIAVFSDLNNGADTALKSAIGLSKMINASIDFFYVKEASRIVASENQLSAMRSINEKYTLTKKQIEDLVNPISNKYNVPVAYSFSFGNVKNEIEKYIAENMPEIIVLGKRKSKKLLGGDRITEFVLNTFKGKIIIAADGNLLNSEHQVSLGLLNETEQLGNDELVSSLLKQSKQPLKNFKVVSDSASVSETGISNSLKSVAYVFERNDQVYEKLTKYISKSNINLLFIGRNGENTMDKENFIKTAIPEVMNKTDVSILIPEEHHFQHNFI